MSREKIRSVILTEDAEFRNKSIAMLNNIAFAAEKTVAKRVEDARALLIDEAYGNLIIDATDRLIPHGLLNDASLIELIKTRRNLFTLIYVKPDEQSELVKHDLVRAANVKLAEIAIDRKHFMEIFHTRRAARGRPRPVVDPELKATAQDAALHLKSVVDKINGIAANKARIDLLADVGQRYNGIMGTFAFFKGTPGAAELAEVGTMVDAIARTYAGSDGTTLSESHFELLAACCRSTLPLLRMIALAEPMTDETKRLFAWARNAYSVDKSLKKRQAIAQTTIDQAMTKRDDKAEEMRKVHFEASGHLKSAIEHLSAVYQDHTRLDALQNAGQRFNGMFGAFAFYKDQVGSASLIELSSVVDDLCRTYADATGAVEADHIQVLRDTAECCLLILKDLREGKAPQEALCKKSDELVKRAQADERIKKRQNIGQGDIDAMLDELQAAA